MIRKEVSLLNPDTFKNEIFDELKNLKFNDFQDMFYRTESSYKESLDVLDTKTYWCKANDDGAFNSQIGESKCNNR